MEIIVCDSTEAFIQSASNWCREQILKYRAQSMFIPAGRTPLGLYEHWEQSKPSYLQGLKLLQIDDVLSGKSRGVFRDFFLKHLPSFQSQIQAIGEATEVGDLSILGLGLNGHVAFHEPGLDPSFFSGCVTLSETTCRTLTLEPGTWGITYGMGAFLRTKAVLMAVQGESKREILTSVLDGDLTLPASSLLQHPDFTVLVDKAALPV